MKLFARISILMNSVFLNQSEANFAKFARKKWPKKRSTMKNEVLVELIPLAVTILPLSSFANALAKHFNADLKSYTPGPYSFKMKLLQFKYFRIYKSFGIKNFVFSKLIQNDESDKLFQEAIKRINSKKDLEDFTLKGVYIGDLVYDSILRTNAYPTVDLNSDLYKKSLKRDIEYFLYWEHYFNTHSVMAVCVSHTCYTNIGIPLRVAIAKGVKVYQCNWYGIFSLDKDFYTAYRESYFFKEGIKKIAPAKVEEGLQIAQERIEKRMSGQASVDMPYSSKSAFVLDPNKKRVLEDNYKVKILIAAHCFFDSPHGYGNNLFPDFIEWLEYVGEIGRKTDYDWYIKTHPDFLPETMVTILKIIEKYPFIKLIPPDSSHLQIVKDGIDCVLTVFGTVGFEYAYMGVKVINASVVGPHSAYSFNFNPTTIEEYGNLLMNLPNLKLSIDRKEILEFYFMKHLYGSSKWYFSDYESFLKAIGGYSVSESPKIYDYFLKEFTETELKRIDDLSLNFIKSGDYWLNKGHVDFK